MKGFINGVQYAKIMGIACLAACCLVSCLSSEPKRVVRYSPYGVVYMQSTFRGMERDKDGKEVVGIDYIDPTVEKDENVRLKPDPRFWWEMAIDHDTRLEIFKKQISKGVDVNACDSWPGIPALAYAAACGDMEYIKELFARGASPRYERDDEDAEGVPMDHDYNPVSLALEHGHRDVAIYLLQHGAKARGVEKAIGKDDIELLDILLAHGAKITENETPRENPSNLLDAESAQMLQYLLKKGADKKKAVKHLVRMSKTSLNPEEYRARCVRIGLVTERELKRLMKKEEDKKEAEEYE